MIVMCGVEPLVSQTTRWRNGWDAVVVAGVDPPVASIVRAAVRSSQTNAETWLGMSAVAATNAGSAMRECAGA
jgi:hypothetical protein